MGILSKVVTLTSHDSYPTTKSIRASNLSMQIRSVKTSMTSLYRLISKASYVLIQLKEANEGKSK